MDGLRGAVTRTAICALAALTLTAAAAWQNAPAPASPPGHEALVTVDYPRDGSIFPPEFPPPEFLWRDGAQTATAWTVEVTQAGGQPVASARTSGPPMRIGKIDPRCVSPTNKPPSLTPEQAAAHTWRPDAAVWAEIKKNSVEGPVTVTVTGYRAPDIAHAVSQGRTTIRTSADAVGAPIFYRDVPLMPSETESGVIKPLDKNAIPLIAWRLRNVGDTSSRVLMTGIHSCANCHSFAADGKTMGMDLDGPRNDKGLYALFPIQPQSVIRDQNVIAWSTFRGKLGGKLRVGFMSQVGPDGKYVVTTINDPGAEQSAYQRRKNPVDLVANYFVANFKDYRFLQVFYPTRGILAWYSRDTGRLEPLPGADDPRYVHTNAVWSPDGSYLVFARAEAKDAYDPARKLAQFANDPNETPMKYDLYRIPFRDGKGGVAEPLAGASANGMSNSFPKISPDGRWIVFVQARNAQLMRPDSRLYIVPSGGGEARLMRCNTPLMNSWHSFSPNGRWLVFSSKSRSPYTQMFLTHLDEDGNDSPAILIENSTDANRAVNIPEFVNVPPGGFLKLDAPVTDYYRIVDTAEDLLSKRQYDAAIVQLKKAVALHPEEAVVQNSLGVALARTGNPQEAILHYRKLVELNPDFPDAHANLGAALLATGRPDDAIAELENALLLSPDYAEAHSNLGTALAQKGRLDLAIVHLRKAVEYAPGDSAARRKLALALYMNGNANEALPYAEQAVKDSGGKDLTVLSLLAKIYAEVGRIPDAVRISRQALPIAQQQNDGEMVEELQSFLASHGAASGAPRR
jgi:Flp pilus assembly protein TadD